MRICPARERELLSSDHQRAALAGHLAACRARIPAFAARHLGWAGTLRLHQRALGLDLVRAPVNVLLVGPALLVRLGAWIAGWLGRPDAAAWLLRRELFLETALARHVAGLVLAELLQLDRVADLPPAWQARSRHLLAEYVAARHAAAELGAVLVLVALGLLLVHRLTPSAISLGPLLAQELVRQEAVAGFWLGPSLGTLWYGWFPVAAGWPTLVASTLGVMLAFALLATFAGLVMDPLQQLLGVHRYRLRRLVDTLERAALGEEAVRLNLPDPYLARLTDLIDMALIAARLTR